jgi:hypothetical protein
VWPGGPDGTRHIVNAEDPGGPGRTIESRAGRTDEDGVAVRTVASGRPLIIHVTAPGFAAREASAFPAREGDLPGRCEVLLDPAGGLTGRVVDAGGGSAAGSSVIVARADRAVQLADPDGRYVPDSFSKPLRTTASADGRFELKGLVPGGAYVAAAATVAGDRSAPVFFIAAAAGVELELPLPLRGSLRVRITGPDGRPAPGSVLRLHEMSLEWDSCSADGSGWVLWDGLPPGRHQLECRSFGLVAVAETVEVAPGEVRELEIRLPRGHAISGVIRDQAGRPVPGARVFAQVPWSTWVGNAPLGDPPRGEAMDGRLSSGLGTSGEDGTFRLEGLAAAVHDLVVEREGHAALLTHGWLPPRDRVDLVLPQTGSARFEVRIATGGSPSGSASVVVVDPIPESGHSLAIVAERWPKDCAVQDGAVVVEGLRPGRQRMVLRFPGYADRAAEVVVEPGAMVDAGRLVLEGGVEVAGRVEDASGRPIPGALLAAISAIDEERGMGACDPEGRFTARELAPGVDRLRVRAEGYLSATVDVPAERWPGGLVVRLERQAMLRVVLRGADGIARTSASVRVRGAGASIDGGEEAMALTDYRGTCDFPLRSGTWIVAAPRWSNEDREVRLEAGGTTTVTLRAHR